MTEENLGWYVFEAAFMVPQDTIRTRLQPPIAGPFQTRIEAECKRQELLQMPEYKDTELQIAYGKAGLAPSVK